MNREFNEKTDRGQFLSFIVMPIIFTSACYIVLFIAFSPVMDSLTKVFELGFTQSHRIFDQVAADIFQQVDPETLPDEGDLKPVAGTIPLDGERFGQVIIESIGVDGPLYYGDSDDVLRDGIGSYTGPGAYIPGGGLTVLLAAHNTTYFHTLGNVQIGDIININTSYGKYVYEVTDSKVANHEDTTAYDLTRTDENLILYTCYPFDMIGLTPDRFFVYAKFVSGPTLEIVG